LTVTLVQRHSVRATYVGSCQDHRDGGPTSAHGSGPSWLCFDLRTHDTKGIVCPEVAAQCCPTEGIRVLWVSKIVGQKRTRTSRELDWENKHEDQSHPTRRRKQQLAVTVISRTAQAWTQNQPVQHDMHRDDVNISCYKHQTKSQVRHRLTADSIGQLLHSMHHQSNPGLLDSTKTDSMQGQWDGRRPVRGLQCHHRMEL
jgi:hypothetical protein